MFRNDAHRLFLLNQRSGVYNNATERRSRRISRGVKIIPPNRYHFLHYADASAKYPARYRGSVVHLVATARSGLLFSELPLYFVGNMQRVSARPAVPPFGRCWQSSAVRGQLIPRPAM